MPTHANLPGATAHPSSRNVLPEDLPRGFVRAHRCPQLAPDLSEYDPAEDRIRKHLLAMGVAMGGRS